ncbi:MAG: hypothetical protein IJ685_03970 [Selenomonadaceae bacterium]|nr:hypothetical protein [Selenomonadaceae bacterium]
MTYEFTNEKVGAMKLQHFHNNTGETFHIAGIDAQQPDANVIIGGINQLLGLVNFQDEYNPEYAIRTVNQSVNVQD